MSYPDRNAPENPDRWRCRNTDHEGNRCSRQGTLGDSTVGHGGNDGNLDPHAYCALHYPRIGTVKTLEIAPLGLGESVGKLNDDNKTWAKRILASPNYHLLYGIESAREALGLEPEPKREPGDEP